MRTRLTETVFGYPVRLVLDVNGREVTVPNAIRIVEEGVAPDVIIDTDAILDAIGSTLIHTPIRKQFYDAHIR